MEAKPIAARIQVSSDTHRDLANFFGGLGCVVTGNPATRASIHHLDGNRSFSDFPNLLPLALDLHTGLKIRLSRERLRTELLEESLTKSGETHFQAGHTTKAYGCIRLAYALAAHFHQPRDLEAEFRLAAHCLYFLRRAVNSARLDLIYFHLSCLVERELKRTLDENRVLPPFGAFCLLIELGSWLNELGWSREGFELLMAARSRLKSYQNLVTAKDVARFQRQIANSLVHMGRYGSELENSIRRASNAGDTSENNRYAVDSVRLNADLVRNQPKAAKDLLNERFDQFEKQTDFCFGSLDKLPQTLQTSLGYIALSLICDSQSVRSRKHRQRLEDRLEALKMQEQRYGVMALLNRTEGLNRAVTRATEAVQPMQKFLDGRMFPQLPRRLAESILEIAKRL